MNKWFGKAIITFSAFGIAASIWSYNDNNKLNIEIPQHDNYEDCLMAESNLRSAEESLQFVDLEKSKKHLINARDQFPECEMPAVRKSIDDILAELPEKTPENIDETTFLYERILIYELAEIAEEEKEKEFKAMSYSKDEQFKNRTYSITTGSVALIFFILGIGAEGQYRKKIKDKKNKEKTEAMYQKLKK